MFVDRHVSFKVLVQRLVSKYHGGINSCCVGFTAVVGGSCVPGEEVGGGVLFVEARLFGVFVFLVFLLGFGGRGG